MRLAHAVAAIANNAVSATICLEFVRSALLIAAAMLMLTKNFADRKKMRIFFIQKTR
jgi:hypothetical protein